MEYDSSMSDLPETLLQFGAGNFLRAFVDLFVHECNASGSAVGRVVVVQSTDSNRADALNARDCRYHVVIRGLFDGQRIDRAQRVESISRALVARRSWPEVLAVARSPDLHWIISNTTEAGFALDPADRPDDAPPRSFPAKLLAVLAARFDADQPGVTILPCELIDGNADRLRELVIEQARQWKTDQAVMNWLQTQCRWHNTLVDQIVTGRPDSHPLLAGDPLLTVAEPYALWVIEDAAYDGPRLEHPAIRHVDDAQPYALRKVRILNGAHTALVCKAMPMGIETVREAVQHAETGPWLRNLLFDEIVPTLEGRVERPERFAAETLERFANPFIEHKLTAIALHHETKIRTRLIPSLEDFIARFSKEPPLLAALLADYHE